MPQEIEYKFLLINDKTRERTTLSDRVFFYSDEDAIKNAREIAQIIQRDIEVVRHIVITDWRNNR